MKSFSVSERIEPELERSTHRSWGNCVKLRRLRPDKSNFKESTEVAEQLVQESRLEQTRSALAIAETVRSEQSLVKADLQEQREQLGERLQRSRESARASRDKFHAVNAVGICAIPADSSLDRAGTFANQQAQLTEQMKGVEQGLKKAGDQSLIWKLN